MADCRKCIYFIPVEELDKETKARALEWIYSRRPRARLLGWCEAYNRPITYYTGKCYKYTPKPPKTIPLDKFT